MHDPNARSAPHGRLHGTAVLALGLLGLWSCSDDLTRPGDSAAFDVPTRVQQALVPGSLTEVKLTASDGAGGDVFGFSVGVSGDVAVIGARGDDDNGSGSGSAYVYERGSGGWDEVQKLTASDGGGGDQFGSSVAMSGDVAVIGARGDKPSGAAYVFERVGSTWVETAKLTGSDGESGDVFGFSVATSGDVVVVGANQDDAGSAYVFERVSGVWVEVEKLIPSDGASNDRFGQSVSVRGDVAVIGAQWDDDNGSTSGSAYVFERAGAAWVQGQKLTPADGAAGDHFGFSVALADDVAVIGADGDDDAGFNSGSAYAFELTGGVWTEVQKLTASDGAVFGNFGTAVALRGDVAVIGARGDDNNSGSAYLFERTGGAWVEAGKVTASDGASFDFFGISVAVSEDAAVIGAHGDDDHGSFSGAAYIFGTSSTLPVAIDIKPGSDDNPVSLNGTNRGRGKSSGSLPVAVLTTSVADGDELDFDATTADPATLTLGDDDGADTPVAERRNGTLRASVEDVDGDGDADLLLHFDEKALVENGDLDGTTAELVLNGETTDGTAITGSDGVRIVGSS